MTIDVAAVNKIAHLARLTIHEKDQAKYATELSKIFELMERLQAQDTAGVEPLMSPLDAVARLRPDVVSETNLREELQRCAPKTEAGLYLVPQVIE